MREIIISKVIDLLHRKGFIVSSYFHLNSCFDIAAKKDKTIFLIKVFENIDATRPEQALELKRLSTALNASAIIIGEKSKSNVLINSLVFERHSLPCINFNTFKNFLNESQPKGWYFKGKTIVELDSQKLKEKRQFMGFTLSDLAKKIESTPKSVYKYEHGAHSSMKIAKKLEKTLSTHLIKDINIIQKHKEQDIFKQKSDDEVFEKIRKLGLELAMFEHAPFEAFSHPKEALLISKAEHNREVKIKGLILNKTKKIVDADSVIIAKESKKKNIANTAVIEIEELDSFTKKKDFLKTIKEREKQ